MIRRKHPGFSSHLAGVLFVVAGLLASSAIAGDRGPGYVDPSKFLDLAGEDSLRLQVNLPGALVRPLFGGDDELAKMAAGLESIHAVIVDLSGKAEAAADLIRKTERELTRKGWSQIATIRDDEGEVRVLVLDEEGKIRGLVVMIADRTEGELVFANISGTLDLEAIKRISEEMNVPGLGDIDLEDD